MMEPMLSTEESSSLPLDIASATERVSKNLECDHDEYATSTSLDEVASSAIDDRSGVELGTRAPFLFISNEPNHDIQSGLGMKRNLLGIHLSKIPPSVYADEIRIVKVETESWTDSETSVKPGDILLELNGFVVFTMQRTSFARLLSQNM